MPSPKLFIILFLHQTTTPWGLPRSCARCLSSCSYIKPQHGHYSADGCRSCLSSCSYIKPQLFISFYLFSFCCLSSCSYIKPQLRRHEHHQLFRCLSSCSYIKPQHGPSVYRGRVVVYHLVPTSNHNQQCRLLRHCPVVYHLVPTSNHNPLSDVSSGPRLFIILFLHQTTTGSCAAYFQTGCLSSCSYIKPQPTHLCWLRCACCLSSCSYIKPQLVYDMLSCRLVVYHLVPTSNHN